MLVGPIETQVRRSGHSVVFSEGQKGFVMISPVGFVRNSCVCASAILVGP